MASSGAEPAGVRLVWAEEDVQAGGVRLHLRRVVEPAAPPVVLLHGLGVSGAVWQVFARRLAPAFAALAPDLRGHGASDAPADGYAPVDYARDLAALLEAEARKPVPLLGHSLGALAALVLADLRPDLVSALVLVDPPIDPHVDNPEVAVVYRLRHAPSGELEKYLLERNPRGGPLLAQMLARLFRQAADAAFETLLEGPAGHPDAWERAGRTVQPVLVVQADPARGGVLGDAAAREFTALLPRGTLHRVPGAGHAVHATHPGELAAVVLPFLERATPGRPTDRLGY